jgi:hypothetical protein
MSKPIHTVQPLTPDQQELIERLTGERYTYGAECGLPADGTICVYAEDDREAVLDIRSNPEIASALDGGLSDPLESDHVVVSQMEIIRDGHSVFTPLDRDDHTLLTIGNHSEEGLVRRLFREIDRHDDPDLLDRRRMNIRWEEKFSSLSEREGDIEIVPRSEFGAQQQWRGEWVARMVKQLTPELAENLAVIDLRAHATFGTEGPRTIKRICDQGHTGGPPV